MKTWEIVITGGPCAGKSIAINIVKNELLNDGFKVIVVPETATELISSGICSWELGDRVFQNILISRAINKEETTREVLNYIKKDTVIIYDRGIFDAKAYMGEDEFREAIDKYNKKEHELMKNYDAVFHLVTAANGAEKFYTLSTNNARKETLEEARNLDKKTIEAWSNHKNFKIIDNSTNFEEKINRLLKEIKLFINNN